MSARALARALAALLLASAIVVCGRAVPARAAAAARSSGCDRPPARVTDRAEMLEVDGRSRRYTWTASDRPGPKPLVLDLHGLLEGWLGVHPLLTQFTPKALADGFVVAYPIGEYDGLLWDVDPNGPSLRFIDALLARIEADACIDRNRVYVTGFSYGAFMSSMLMCERSDVFAAAAPVAGLVASCGSVSRKVPVVTFHGTSDPILWYPLFQGAPQAWADAYGCGPSRRSTITGADAATGQAVYLDRWDCRSQHTDVESYVIEGGGHSWPGSWGTWLGWFVIGPTALSINATDIMWDFFARHTRNGAP